MFLPIQLMRISPYDGVIYSIIKHLRFNDLHINLIIIIFHDLEINKRSSGNANKLAQLMRLFELCAGNHFITARHLINNIYIFHGNTLIAREFN